MTKKMRPYGLWDSTISPEQLAAKSTRLGTIQVINGSLFWLESRPEEKGRGVICCLVDGNKKDITPKDYSVRTRAHEYGGGDFWGRDDKLIFANDKDQRLYLQCLNTNQVEPITVEPDFAFQKRYTDGDIHPNNRFSMCVYEQHDESGSPFSVTNELLMLDLKEKMSKVVATGFDFYSNPRFSPDGKKVSWLCWQHPNMPWDATELWVADCDEDGTLTNAKKVAGGGLNGKNVSVYNPQWSDKSELFFAADNHGYWYIYNAADTNKPVHKLLNVEFGLPQWIFGCNSFCIIQNSIYAIGAQNGEQKLYKINLEDASIEVLLDEFCAFNGSFAHNKSSLFFNAATRTSGAILYELDLETDLVTTINKSESSLTASNISQAQNVVFPTTDGQQAYGFYYPPKSDEFASDDELAPVIVMSHGGPTGMTDAGFNMQVQYWTNRGFAVADVNYRGSTGYGRQYRDSLKGQWGIYDVDDCVAMVEFLAAQGLVDRNRAAIRGGSAGGFTTLCALTFTDAFKVGMSRYGVADLLSLAQDSHKFEIRYLDSVVGSLPESEQIYLDRSPCEHTDKLSCPILLLQGSDDKVVPPSQAKAMVQALEEKGLEYQYIEFEGEGHGFRKPETIIQAFEAELQFYQKYLV